MNAETEKRPLPTIAAGGAVKAIVPQDFDGAWRIANAVCKAGMAPRGLDNPEQAMVAIMHGLEVGFTPMAALQSIAVINGRPAIWGDGALALVQASGKLEAHKEWVEGEGDNLTAYCHVKRRGDPELKEGKFSVAKAKKAHLWGKKGPWTEYPERMLQMRARGFALRDGFSDVLRGLGIAEEVQDTPMRDVTPPTPPEPPAPPPPEPEIIEPDQEQVDADLDAGVVDGEIVSDTDFLTELEEAMAVATDAKTIDEIWVNFEPDQRFVNDEMSLTIAGGIRRRFLTQIEQGEAQ